MKDETIVIPPENVEILDASEYKEELSQHFEQVPEVAKPLLKGAKMLFSKIEKTLYTAPAFINAVKAAIPDVTLQAVLTDEQKKQIAKGALKLMTKKDGSLMANLINPETKKIVATIPLKSVQMAPEMTQASYVEKVLCYFRNRDGFASFKTSELKDYEKFKGILIEFRSFYGLDQYNLKEIDKYMWQLGREYFPKNYRKKKSQKD